MKPTTEQKALAACREYVRLQEELKKLTFNIGGNLRICEGVNGKLKSLMWGDANDETHLARHYRNKRVESELRETGGWPHSEEAEFLACKYCVQADALIQQRKAARQSLGAAKRQITKLGKLP